MDLTPQGEAIPLGVVNALAGFEVPEVEVMRMTKAEVIERMARLYGDEP